MSDCVNFVGNVEQSSFGGDPALFAVLPTPGRASTRPREAGLPATLSRKLVHLCSVMHGRLHRSLTANISRALASVDATLDEGVLREFAWLVALIETEPWLVVPLRSPESKF